MMCGHTRRVERQSFGAIATAATLAADAGE
jgi:hypothetical protein